MILEHRNYPNIMLGFHLHQVPWTLKTPSQIWREVPACVEDDTEYIDFPKDRVSPRIRQNPFPRMTRNGDVRAQIGSQNTVARLKIARRIKNWEFPTTEQETRLRVLLLSRLVFFLKMSRLFTLALLFYATWHFFSLQTFGLSGRIEIR